MPHPSKNPFMFACGVPRSGTTLLQRLLDGHPELAVANDTHFIPRALKLTDKRLLELAISGKPIPLTPELIQQVKDYHRTVRLGLDLRTIDDAASGADSYQDFVSAMYDRFAHAEGKPLAGEKTPDYVSQLTLLHGLFPDAKLVHLVRDGRNVALSLLQWALPGKGPAYIELWDTQPLAVCALWWRWFVLSGHVQSSILDPGLCVTIRYEELIDEPAGTMIELCEFLDIPFSNDMLTFKPEKIGPRKRGDLSSKSARLAPQKGMRNWRVDMAPANVALFEALAGDALELYGYSCVNDQFNSATLDLANECNQWWQNNFARRNPTPVISTAGTAEDCEVMPSALQWKGQA